MQSHFNTCRLIVILGVSLPCFQQIPSGGLMDMCRKPMSPVHFSSISEWLVSIGMPMYSDLLLAAGYDTLSHLSTLTEAAVRKAGLQEERHIRRLLSEARLITANSASQF